MNKQFGRGLVGGWRGAATADATAADREVRECRGVKTARCELRHESMKCKNKGRNGGTRWMGD